MIIVGGDAGGLRVGQEQGATRCCRIASAAVTQPTRKNAASLRVAPSRGNAARENHARRPYSLTNGAANLPTVVVYLGDSRTMIRLTQRPSAPMKG